MATNGQNGPEKTTIMITASGGQNVVHSNPSQAPTGSLATGGKLIDKNTMSTWKNPA